MKYEKEIGRFPPLSMTAILTIRVIPKSNNFYSEIKAQGGHTVFHFINSDASLEHGR
jgi:hypothetical protein